MLVVGDREEAEGTVSVRSHDEGDIGAIHPEEVARLLYSPQMEGTEFTPRR
jgi:threonyl-tRNA synthetase